MGEAHLPSSGSEYKLLSTIEFIKAVSDTVLGMMNAVCHDKPLIFIRAMFWEKLISHHQAVNILWLHTTQYSVENLAVFSGSKFETSVFLRCEVISLLHVKHIIVHTRKYFPD